MQIDEDTHLSLRGEPRVIGSVPLEKTYRRSLFHPISRPNRKNLAVHVSLSSIFTMSKSGPWEPLSRAASWKRCFLIFGNRILLPVPRQHICPIRKSLPPGRKAVCISEAGYMADGFCCQHPKMTKPTKNETPILSSKIPSRAGAFLPARREACMWELGKESARTTQRIPPPPP